jgi:hypothetical protein
VPALAPGAFLRGFQRVWCVDFEYGTRDDSRPDVRCCVLRELFSGRIYRVWEDKLKSGRWRPPYNHKTDLFVAYASMAELGCLRKLGLPMPWHICDLHFEFLAIVNGARKNDRDKSGLIYALAHYGLHHIDAEEGGHAQAGNARRSLHTRRNRSDP